ncbi:MAG: universal stress protein [Acidobacteria bacterium]|nr:universal stress protein [Acidobacteriota bacterium]
MKVLIVYDGSQAAESELQDLQKAGLSDCADVLALAVVETWSSLEKAREIEKLAVQTKEYLRQEFPLWRIRAETVYGSPAREVLIKAESFRPDLIVIGEPCHEKTEKHTLLGKISQKVLGELPCSVRIARCQRGKKVRPARIVVGFDGSIGAQTAIDAVASRSWRKDSEVRLVVVNDANMASSVGHFPAPTGSLPGEAKLLEQLMEKTAEAPIRKLKAAGLSATLWMATGDPKDVLLEQAEKWHADSIFVGPNRIGRSFDRFMLGTISSAVAARASCSVEVARDRHRI